MKKQKLLEKLSGIGHGPSDGSVNYNKYADLPMDLADASLVILAEELDRAVFFLLTLTATDGKTISRFKTCYCRICDVATT